MALKHVSIVTPCFNEAENVTELRRQVREIFDALEGYTHEHIFIDNASTDATVTVLKDLAKTDKQIKIIVNTRNFGHIRSPYHALLQSTGDCAIILAADLQEPPSMIPKFLAKWREGFKIVAGVKVETREPPFIKFVRRMFYRTIARLSDTKLIENYNGFGLYDRVVLETLRAIDDPYPYLRGLIAETGYETAQIEYVQAARYRGMSANSFYTLYDIAMLGFTNHSKVPLRLAAMAGFGAAVMSLLSGVFYFAYKLISWDIFSVGVAPAIIGVFFLSSVNLFFLGIVGEYIGTIHTQIQHRPLVIEKERVNFDD